MNLDKLYYLILIYVYISTISKRWPHVGHRFLTLVEVMRIGEYTKSFYFFSQNQVQLSPNVPNYSSGMILQDF